MRPGSVGPVDLGVGRGDQRRGGATSCAPLDEGNVAAWAPVRRSAALLRYARPRRQRDAWLRRIGEHDDRPRLPPRAPRPRHSRDLPRRRARRLRSSSSPRGSSAAIGCSTSGRRSRAWRRAASAWSCRPVAVIASRFRSIPAGTDSLRRPIPRAQAQLRTGILTIAYPGGPTRVRRLFACAPPRSAPTRACSARRSATAACERGHAQPAPRGPARGRVRVQIEYVAAGRRTMPEGSRRGSPPVAEPAALADHANAIAERTGAVHSYTQVAGCLQARMRGEMRSFQILLPCRGSIQRKTGNRQYADVT